MLSGVAQLFKSRRVLPGGWPLSGATANLRSTGVRGADLRTAGLAAVCCLYFVALSGATVATAAPDPGAQVADLAQQYVGSAYRWGGSSPAGFDCTGFVMWVYGQFGVALPHNEAGQLASGPRVDADDLQPGDVLVFTNTYRRGLSHVGIYLGDGRFVHAVDEAHGVMVSSLWDSYWAPRFVGASRAMG